jgi:hypothetical protein
VTATLSAAERVGWIGALAALPVLAIPWFLWGSDLVVAGLPVWLWWHIGWMGLASAVFWLFTRRAWGLGIVANDSTQPPDTQS